MTNSAEHVLESATLQTVGLSCGSCVKHVEEALQGTTGVGKAVVDLAVKDAGYDLILPESN